MSTLISTIASSKIKARWEEPYTSQAINSAFTALGKGIVRGFFPAPGGDLDLELIDGEDNLSLAFIYDPVSKVTLLYREEASFTIDLSPFSGDVIYLGITIEYAVLTATTGEIRAYTKAEYEADPPGVIWICGITVPADTITADLIDLSCRTIPGLSSLKIQSTDHDYSNVIQDPGFLGAAVLYPPGPDVSGSNVDVFLEPSSYGRALTFEHASGTASKERRVAVVPVTEGEHIILQLRRRLISASAANAGFRIYWRNENGAAVSNEWVSPGSGVLSNVTEAWTEYRFSRAVPSGARFAHVFIAAQSVTGGKLAFEFPYVSTTKNPDRAGSAAPISTTSVGYLPSDLGLNTAHTAIDGTGSLRTDAFRWVVVASDTTDGVTGIVAGSVGLYVNPTDQSVSVVGGVFKGDAEFVDLEVTNVATINEILAVTLTVSGNTRLNVIKDLNPNNADILVGADAYIEVPRTIHSLAATSYTGDDAVVGSGFWRVDEASGVGSIVYSLDVIEGQRIQQVVAHWIGGHASCQVVGELTRTELSTGTVTTVSTDTVSGLGLQLITLNPAHTVLAGFTYAMRLTMTNGPSGSLVSHGIRYTIRAYTLAHAF